MSNGYENFTDAALDIMNRHNIQDLNSLDRVLTAVELLRKLLTVETTPITATPRIDSDGTYHYDISYQFGLKVVKDLSDKQNKLLKDFLLDYCGLKKSTEILKEIKKGIAWRKESYERDLARGEDADGWKLTKTDRLILENLYNIMITLEGYFEK